MERDDPGFCGVCGGKTENVTADICYGCHLAGFLPAGYQKRERYLWDSAFAHLNATAHPQTGNALLDSTPRRPSESGRRIKLRRNDGIGLELREFLMEGLACHQAL